MTYCVGMVLDKGLVLMSDTRTNSGVDNISTFRKMFSWQQPGEHMISIMTAGNLATTQAVVSQFPKSVLGVMLAFSGLELACAAPIARGQPRSRPRARGVRAKVDGSGL